MTAARATIDAAIRAHGGEAAAAQDAYDALAAPRSAPRSSPSWEASDDPHRRAA